MKKRYIFLLKYWWGFSFAAAFAAFLSLDASAQTGPAKLWDKTFGGSSGDNLTSIKQTTDGGYILGGSSISGVSGDKSEPNKGTLNYTTNDFWVVKLDAAGTKMWDKTFGGGSDDWLHALQQTSDGGYILGGTTYSGVGGDKSQASQGSSDYWLVKLDPNGNKQWDKTFGGNSMDALASLQQTSDGGYILGGSSISGISGDKSQPRKGAVDYWIIKLDANGTKVWDKTFGGTMGAGAYGFSSLQQTSDGGYILGGYSSDGFGGDKTQPSQGNADYWVVKIDVQGNKLWDKTFGGNNLDALTSLQQTSDGGYILGGYSDSGLAGDKSQAGLGGKDFWVVKMDAAGNKSWDKTYGGIGDDALYTLQQTLDGGYLIGGTIDSVINNSQPFKDTDFRIIKLNANGTQAWAKTLGGTGEDHIRSLKQSSDGGYILGGFSRSTISRDKTQVSNGDFDYWIVKLGPDILGTKEDHANFNLTLSPNPSHGKFHLHLSGLTAPTAEVTVTDLLGRVILQQEFKTVNGHISEQLILPVIKGLYILKLKVNGQVTSRKIVIE